jgi:hypothetical protein
VAVAVLVLAVYLVGFYLPAHDVVTMEGGSWIVNGASSSLGIQVGCSNCGQTPAAGSEFTINVNVGVSSTNCGFYVCPDYSVQSFSVTGPYVLDAVAPNNLPYGESSGSFNTWELTVTAPATPGHYAIGGIVGVTYA